MKSSKHILLVTPGFPADENDYLCTPMIQEFLIGFAKYFSEVKFSVVALHYPYKKTNYKWHQTNVYPLSGKNKKGLNRLILWRRAIKKIKEINNFHKIDSLHSLWLGETTIIANRVSKKIAVPHIATLMGQDVLKSNPYLKFLSLENVKLAAVSKFQSEVFNRNKKRDVDAIIHWGIENNEIVNTPERDIDLLAAGSLIELKNYDLFINLVRKLIQSYPAIKCVLVGDGQERENLKGLITQFNLEKNIEMTGNLERNKVLELMRKSKIFVHPSRYESFGYVFAEALINGMTIVSRRTGAAFVCEKWFIAENDDDFSILANQLLSKNISCNSFNPFPLEKTVRAYKEIYEQSNFI